MIHSKKIEPSRTQKERIDQRKQQESANELAFRFRDRKWESLSSEEKDVVMKAVAIQLGFVKSS